MSPIAESYPSGRERQSDISLAEETTGQGRVNLQATDEQVIRDLALATGQ